MKQAASSTLSFETQDVLSTWVLWALIDLRKFLIFTCFQTGSHWLNVEMGRFNLHRSQRVCACCDSSEAEDEMHLLVCPVYAHIHNNLDLSFEQLLCYHFQDEELNMRLCSYMNSSPTNDETLVYNFWQNRLLMWLWASTIVVLFCHILFFCWAQIFLLQLRILCTAMVGTVSMHVSHCYGYSWWHTFESSWGHFCNEG
jgi:hypothetical protein